MIMKKVRHDRFWFGIFLPRDGLCPFLGTASSAWGGQRFPLASVWRREKRFVSVPEVGYGFHNCSAKQLSEQTPANSFASHLLPL